MNIYILTEGRNFKTFLENYITAWDSCYLFTKLYKTLIMELNMILTVLMGFVYVRQS